MRICPKCGCEKAKSSFRIIEGRYSICKECEKEQHLKWLDANKSRVRSTQAEWRKRNPHNAIKNAEHARKHYALNKDSVKERIRLREKELSVTPFYRVNKAISVYMRNCLRRKKNGLHWEVIVGYSIDALMHHLQKQFTDGMSWDNYGKWHIDHIIPISAFHFSGPEDIDFKRCWSLSNLRPMWGVENMKKGAKLSKPFQPALALVA
jgi:hypothetical protein